MTFAYALLLKGLVALVFAFAVYAIAKLIWRVLPNGPLKEALFKERGSRD